jgi:hypothetical protein
MTTIGVLATASDAPLRVVGLLLAFVVAVWIVRDAARNGRNWGLWLAYMLIFWPLGILTYIVLRLTGRWRRDPVADCEAPAGYSRTRWPPA